MTREVRTGVTAVSLALTAWLFVAAAGARADSPPGVAYFAASDVKAAFEKGAVLAKRENYMVHASRRDAAGQAEVHVKDADIIYVLEGSSTFVTGGRVVEGKETAPDEIRGSRIEGGETRTISPGDVLIVPRGTPHWFKEIQGPVVYYVVKVR
ncbi:MAG TPA: cupin domain-containing protein [Verrucomicrobiae bacterium]|nr:cupin domain-containing protein [Verrucomicrobiae bacterium]